MSVMGMFRQLPAVSAALARLEVYEDHNDCVHQQPQWKPPVHENQNQYQDPWDENRKSRGNPAVQVICFQAIGQISDKQWNAWQHERKQQEPERKLLRKRPPCPWCGIKTGCYSGLGPEESQSVARESECNRDFSPTTTCLWVALLLRSGVVAPWSADSRLLIRCNL